MPRSMRGEQCRTSLEEAKIFLEVKTEGEVEKGRLYLSIGESFLSPGQIFFFHFSERIDLITTPVEFPVTAFPFLYVILGHHKCHPPSPVQVTKEGNES